MWPRTTVIGVRSSWLTSSRSSRRATTARSTRSSILLTAAAKADRSSLPRTGTRVARSASPMESVARRSSPMGRRSLVTANQARGATSATVPTAETAYSSIVEWKDCE